MSLLGLLLPHILSTVGSKFCTQPGNSVLDPQKETEKFEDMCMCLFVCAGAHVYLKLFIYNVARYSV